MMNQLGRGIWEFHEEGTGLKMEQKCNNPKVLRSIDGDEVSYHVGACNTLIVTVSARIALKHP